YVVPTGSVVVPTGRYAVPTGRVVVPTGRVISPGRIPTGRYVVPTGRVVVPTGRVISPGRIPTGRYVVPTGRVVVPTSRVISPGRIPTSSSLSEPHTMRSNAADVEGDAGRRVESKAKLEANRKRHLEVYSTPAPTAPSPSSDMHSQATLAKSAALRFEPTSKEVMRLPLFTNTPSSTCIMESRTSHKCMQKGFESFKGGLKKI
nr:hypothetical protein [Tanacetum cinerariifolium]